MNNNDHKINSRAQEIAKNAKIGHFFSFIGITAILLLIISIGLGIGGFTNFINNNVWAKYVSFEDYLGLIFDSHDSFIGQKYEFSKIDNAFKWTFVVGIILVGVAFIATLITSIIVVSQNKFIEKNYDDSILGIGIISIFLGIFTGISLNKKIKSILQNPVINQTETKSQLAQEQIKKSLDLSDPEQYDDLKTKLENALKLKNAGLINENDYYILKEKIVKES